MADYDYLLASSGAGDAALMHVEADRLTGSATLVVDSVVNVPSKFIATVGDALPSGFIDPTTKIEFKGHVSSGDLIIDGYLNGSTDAGNTSGQIVVIKPNTSWANLIADFIRNATNLGTPEAVTFTTITATAITASSLTTSGNGTIGGNVTVTGNITIAGTSHVTSQGTATANGSNQIVPTSQIYNVTALAHDAELMAPSITPADGMTGEIQIKDNGTARALTYSADWVPIGLTPPSVTVAGNFLYIGWRYSGADSKYHIRSIARQ